jgi:hypothetical protein
VEDPERVTTSQLPDLGISYSQTLKKEWSLNNILCIHARQSAFDFSKTLLHNSVAIPIKFLGFVSFAQFDKTTNELSVPQVVAVVEIEENLVSTLHDFEVNIVF